MKRPTPKAPITEFQNYVNKEKTRKASRIEKRVTRNLDQNDIILNTLEFMRQNSFLNAQKK